MLELTYCMLLVITNILDSVELTKLVSVHLIFEAEKSNILLYFWFSRETLDSKNCVLQFVVTYQLHAITINFSLEHWTLSFLATFFWNSIR